MHTLELPAAILRPCEQTIEALRAELLHYGAVLNLFDLQQEAMLSRNSALISEVERALTAQLKMLCAQRSHRKQLTSALAPGHREPTPRQTIQLFPKEMRPLVVALTTEVNRLASRVRRREQQNKRLWTRINDAAQNLDGKPQRGAGFGGPRETLDANPAEANESSDYAATILLRMA